VITDMHICLLSVNGQLPQYGRLCRP